MNVGIIGYQEGGMKALFLMFFAPHAIFELPAAWLSIAFGIRLGWEIITPNPNIGWVFYKSLFLYLSVILPLLCLFCDQKITAYRFVSAGTIRCLKRGLQL